MPSTWYFKNTGAGTLKALASLAGTPSPAKRGWGGISTPEATRAGSATAAAMSWFPIEEMLVLLLPTCVASDVSAEFVSADVEAVEGGAVSTLAGDFCAGVVFGLAVGVAFCAGGS